MHACSLIAIINPPQAAILAVGATIPTPALDAAGKVVVEPRMKMTLSCAHRVVDGAMTTVTDKEVALPVGHDPCE